MIVKPILRFRNKVLEAKLHLHYVVADLLPLARGLGKVLIIFLFELTRSRDHFIHIPGSFEYENGIKSNGTEN